MVGMVLNRRGRWSRSSGYHGDGEEPGFNGVTAVLASDVRLQMKGKVEKKTAFSRSA